LALMNFKWNKIIGGDAAETGSGAGSYDIRKSVWHVNVRISISSKHSI
jgi:high-affinity iron transporter